MAEQSIIRFYPDKPRVFITTDISNEPDDAESFVRYLLYSNELDTQGLVACTSTWMRRNVHPEDLQKIVEAYAEVFGHLSAHVHPKNPYPSPEYLLSIIKSGPPVYGKEALALPLSDGAALLVERLVESESPLWLLCWGGTNVLAQALQHIRQTRSDSEAKRLHSRLRVYAISDQDDTGLWIRVNFPDVFYICSVHGWKEYGMAAWIGISGNADNGGPDSSKITKEWIKANIQVGPLGSAYPDYAFIMERDTPTFLYLIQNGLGSPEHPEWGSWGGRYVLADIGGAGNHYSGARDKVIGKNGQTFVSNHATIWRWRDFYQNDFAARMQWTLSSDRSLANHAPVVIVNESTSGPEPFKIEAEAASEITLDASESYDPDTDELSFTWFQYKEPTAAQSHIHWPAVPDVEFTPAPLGPVAKAKLPSPEVCAVDILTGKALKCGQVFHLILQVTDNGTPSLTTYKRILIQTTNRQLRGGQSKVYDTITEALGHHTK